MRAYILRRLFALIPVLFGVSVVVFFLLRLVPGDPIMTVLGEVALAPPEVVAELRQKYGLDQPIYVQYGKWLWTVLHGDLGRSFFDRHPVTQMLLARLRATFMLAIVSLLIAVVGGVSVGVAAARTAAGGKNLLLEKTLTLSPLLLLAIPSFALGLFLIVIFAARLKVLPATGMYSPIGGGDPSDLVKHLLMPAVTLAAVPLAVTARLTRASLLEVIRADYIRTAYAKGLHERLIFYQHALKNALIPVVTNSGIVLGNLLAGSMVVETVFSWPGIGWMMVGAVGTRDYPVVQGGALLIASTYVLANLLVDISYAYIDPRIRYGR